MSNDNNSQQELEHAVSEINDSLASLEGVKICLELDEKSFSIKEVCDAINSIVNRMRKSVEKLDKKVS